ncbi:hypothetical protein [Deinococcus sp.]|uniref:hypothetical protein n=1 Tax=Deinococcus sp. TaxID=47478 RepID=UPI0025C5BA2F|nr:hypothetical protein [Deinococcus sp.]
MNRPKHITFVAAALAAALCSNAGAMSADFSVGSTGASGTLARVGVSEITLAGGNFSVGLSNRAADVGFSRGLALPPLGAVNVTSGAKLAYDGGLQLSALASGTLGPVALKLGSAYFTAPATTFDPLVPWTLTPTDLRPRGWNTALNLRYRLSRARVLVLGGEFGPQNNGLFEVETHRDLTRTLPPAEGDDPSAPPETERTGTLTYRLGACAGHDALGVVGGVSYATEAGRTFTLDAQFGPERGGHSGLGVVGSVAVADVLGEGSTLRAYGAYEPWRQNAAQLRLGLEGSKPLGPGTLTVAVRGGRTTGAAELGFGLSAGYSLVIGGHSPAPAGQPAP